MKKNIAKILLLITMLFSMQSLVYSYDVPEAYMGFSVPQHWYVLSKNMTDDTLLKAAGLTVDEVNEALVKSDCEYYIAGPEIEGDIYVKVKDNDLSYEFYNIAETDDAFLVENIDRILKDGFSMEGFSYDIANVAITPYEQMKFITVPGAIYFDGANHGLVFGATFVNGKGIGFLLHLDREAITPEDMTIMSELAQSVSFTVIKEKGSAKSKETPLPTHTDSSLAYIAGGLGGVALVALCLYFIDRIKKSEQTEQQREDEDESESKEAHQSTD